MISSPEYTRPLKDWSLSVTFMVACPSISSSLNLPSYTAPCANCGKLLPNHMDAITLAEVREQENYTAAIIVMHSVPKIYTYTCPTNLGKGQDASPIPFSSREGSLSPPRQRAGSQ